MIIKEARPAHKRWNKNESTPTQNQIKWILHFIKWKARCYLIFRNENWHSKRIKIEIYNQLNIHINSKLIEIEIFKLQLKE